MPISPEGEWMRHRRLFAVTFITVFLCLAGSAVLAQSQQSDVSVPAADASASAPTTVPDAPGVVPDQQKLSQDAKPTGMASSSTDLNGTVTDVNGDLVPGATVVVEGASPSDRQSQEANDNAFFNFPGLKAGVAYRLIVSAKGFEDWVSPPITLAAGQFYGVSDVKLKLEGNVSSVTVYSSTEQIAAQQVRLEEQQRIMGFIPNFYVVYDSKNAVPLTTKMKFQMAYRVSIDPVSFVGAAALAGMNQGGDDPNYPLGAKGFGERFGASYADGVTDIMFGGAILPSLLHQDPRYFYQGTGTVKSRLRHALANPFICRGDSGKSQPNYSSIGGDLISSSISNIYYPPSNRGASLVFGNLLLSTGEREISSVIQEFVIRRLTQSAKNQN
jgi:hypothetical protein